jgi:hypothetical protein
MKNENIEILQSFTKAKLIELHNAKDQHIQDLYNENDSQRETIEECCEEIDGKAIKIQSMLETNANLAAQVLDLKAQLHDLLR